MVPVHANLQQLSELWSLKQMGFLPPLPYLLCYPRLLSFRVKAEGFVCTVSLWGWVYRWNSPEAIAVFCLASNFSIQVCTPSMRMVFLRYRLWTVESKQRQVSNSCFQIVCVWHLHLPSLADCYFREKSIVALLHRSDLFSLVTMGQRLSVPIVTVKTSLCQQPCSVKLNLMLHLKRWSCT